MTSILGKKPTNQNRQVLGQNPKFQNLVKLFSELKNNVKHLQQETNSAIDKHLSEVSTPTLPEESAEQERLKKARIISKISELSQKQAEILQRHISANRRFVRIPVSTSSARKKLEQFGSRLRGFNISSEQEQNNIVPVKIYKKPQTENFSQFDPVKAVMELRSRKDSVDRFPTTSSNEKFLGYKPFPVNNSHTEIPIYPQNTKFSGQKQNRAVYLAKGIYPQVAAANRTASIPQNRINFNNPYPNDYHTNTRENRPKPEPNLLSNPEIYTPDFSRRFDSKNQNTIVVANRQPKRGLSLKINWNFLRLAAATSIFLISILSFTFIYNFYLKTKSPQKQAVAGALDDKKQKYPNLDQYKDWILDKNSNYSDPEKDLDQDGLTNYEEFTIGTNPTDAHTCKSKLTDTQNLLKLINPVDCKNLNLKDAKIAEKFGQIINFPEVQKNFIEDLSKDDTKKTGKSNSSSNLLGLFGVKNYEDLDKLSPNTIDQEVKVKSRKKDYLQQIEKIEQYVEKYRSYDVFDRNYDLPVHPAIYLETSIKYNVPLKYVLAIARTESRFGSDRYTGEGQLTRPGKYKNIYSLGLTDSGSNVGFKTWEDGVYAFGRWYKRFNDRGVADCSKWKIFNPNGDYCAKIEKLGKEIDSFLKE